MRLVDLILCTGTVRGAVVHRSGLAVHLEHDCPNLLGMCVVRLAVDDLTQVLAKFVTDPQTCFFTGNFT